MYIGQPMTDEPTPVAPPPVMAPEPLRFDPRSSPIGWIVSGVLLVLAIAGSIAGYASQFGKPAAPTLYDESLKYSVSLYASSASLDKQFAEPMRQGLVDTMESALKDAPDSDAAAIAALVASHELKKDPPKAAIDRLASSDDPVSQDVLYIYTGEFVTQEFVNGLDARQGSGFAFELAKVHAREMIDLPSGRDQIIDKAFLFKVGAVFSIVSLAFIAGVACIVFFLSGRAAGRIVPVGFGLLQKSDGDRYMLRFAFYLIAFAVLGVLASGLEDNPITQGASPIWITFGTMLAIGLVTIALFRVPVLGKIDSVREIVAETWPMGRLIKTGLAGYLCTVPILGIVLVGVGLLSQHLPAPSHPITEDFARASGLDWFAIFVVAAVLAPLVEELTFRGLMLPALATRLKPIAAVLLCGFVFAAIHPQGPLIWPALMTTGAVAAYLRYLTGSLVPSIVLHVVHNGLIFLMSTVLT